jgi:hypothetical protein
MQGMKRIQLFEFEDFGWFPDALRRSMTRLIALLHKMVGTKEVIGDLLAPIIKEIQNSRIVDLGSGSGGIMPEVMKYLEEEYNLNHLNLLLTDLYPNLELSEKLKISGSEKISYSERPIDATDLSQAPEGLRTMINCFHHMEPKKARKILRSAQESRQAILIYEMGENNIPLLIWWLLLPLSLTILIIMVLFMTLWVRPMTWQQLVFTYLIPIIPLCYAWDGQASLPRMYTMADLDILLSEPAVVDYQWKKGKAFKKNGKKLGTYLIGLPTK